MNPHLALFLDIYRKHLEHAVITRPDEYSWPLSQFETVFERMKSAIKKGTFNKDSIAFKNTCKELEIKHTYKAINEFITNNGRFEL